MIEQNKKKKYWDIDQGILKRKVYYQVSMWWRTEIQRLRQH